MSVNLLNKERTSRTDNLVTIVNQNPILPDILNAKSLYTFPDKVLENKAISPKYNIRGTRGTVEYMFRHTNGMMCYIVKVKEGRLKNNYLVSTRSGFKKNGNITVKVSDFDTDINKVLRTTKRH